MQDVYENTELIELCATMRDGTATPEQTEKLAELLRQSQAARRFYLKFMSIHATLERYQQSIYTDVLPAPLNSSSKPGNWRRVAALAAAACVALVLTLMFKASVPETAVKPAPVPTAQESIPVKAPEVWAFIDEASPTAILVRNGKNGTAQSHMRLEPGDILITTANCGAVIRYVGEETMVGVFSGSRVVFERTDGAKYIRLINGGLVCDVAKQLKDQPLRLRTPHAEAVVLGTQFVLAADEKKSHLRVNEGTVRFTDLNSEQTVEAGAGFESEVGEGFKLNLLRRDGAEHPRVVGFTLVDADTGDAVAGLDPIQDKAVIRISQLPSPRINIKANTLPASVGTVKFRFSGTGSDGRPVKFFNHEGHNFANHAEVWWPYHIAGDDDNFSKPKPRIWIAQPGTYTLSAHAFLPAKQQGLKSEPYEIQFTIEP